jgi:hypothetical protein
MTIVTAPKTADHSDVPTIPETEHFRALSLRHDPRALKNDPSTRRAGIYVFF